MRLVTAVSVGPEFREKLFLGGNAGSSFLTAVAENVYSLRGFPLSASRRGTGVAALYMEYRFPIWHVERGLWTLPGYLERFHMAVFAEGGNTFGNGEEENLGDVFEKAAKRVFQGGNLGVGAELRVDMNFGWAFPLTVRGGAALAVLDTGVVPGKPVPEFYLAFGSAL